MDAEEIEAQFVAIINTLEDDLADQETLREYLRKSNYTALLAELLNDLLKERG